MKTTVKNLAPVQPLLALQTKGQSKENYLAEALKSRFDEYMAQDQETWDEVARTTEIVSNFTQGKQIFSYNYWTGEYGIQKVRQTNPNKITAINLMQYYLTDNLQRLSSSNPDLEPSEEFLRSEYRSQVENAKAVWNRYEQKFYTDRFNQQEALHSIISGNYFESCQYDVLQHSVEVFRDIFGEVDYEISPGRGKCFEGGCGFEGVSRDFLKDDTIPVCPECGSYAVTHESAYTETIMQPVGQEAIRMGDFSLKLIPLQSIRFDLTVRAEESSWCIERMEVPNGRLRLIFGDNVDIDDDDAPDKGLQSLRNIQRAGNTLQGKWRDREYSSTKTSIIDRFSFMPEDVADITLAHDEETIGGRIIPKGTKLSNLCPNGGIALGKGGLKHIIGLYPNVHHSQELTSGTFHMRLASGLGRGSEDTVEVQKRFNRFDAQHVRFMGAAATPAHTYVDGAVDRQHIRKIGHPGVVIPIRQEMATMLGQADLVQQIKPATIAGNFFDYTYHILNRYRQQTSHNTNNSYGAPDIDPNTATAARIGDANAAAIWVPMLQVKGKARVRTAENLIQAYPRHFQGVSQFFVLGKTSANQVKGKYLKGEDIDPTIRFIVMRNSEQPKTRYHQQADFERFVTIMGGAAGIIQLQQADPKLYQFGQDTYGLHLEQDSYDVLEDICRDRLGQALHQLGTLQSMIALQGGDPDSIPLEMLLTPDILAMTLDPPIEVFEGKHDEKLIWFQEYLDTPEGYELGGLERKVVGLFIQVHMMKAQEAAAILAQSEGAVQQAAEGPARQQAIEEQAAIDEAARANAEAERQAQQEDKIQDAQIQIAKDTAMAEVNNEQNRTD